MNYAGIDVSKAHLDVSMRPIGSQWRVSNTEAGIGQVVTRTFGS